MYRCGQRRCRQRRAVRGVSGLMIGLAMASGIDTYIMMLRVRGVFYMARVAVVTLMYFMRICLLVAVLAFLG